MQRTQVGGRENPTLTLFRLTTGKNISGGI